MGASEPITLSRACEVIEIPSGTSGTLPAGAVVRIMQSLPGSGYTVATDRGYMYRIDAKGLHDPYDGTGREGGANPTGDLDDFASPTQRDRFTRTHIELPS